MKNSKKGFIVPLLVTIIILLTIGGGYYYLQNKNLQDQIYQKKLVENNTVSTTTATTTTNDTSDWKTYTLKGYEFKYPSNYLGYGSGAKDGKPFDFGFQIPQSLGGGDFGIGAFGLGSTLIETCKDFINTGIKCDDSKGLLVATNSINPEVIKVFNLIVSSIKPLSEITEITIISYGPESIPTVNNNLIIITDTGGAKWTVNYKDAKFYQENTQAQPPVWPVSFNTWLTADQRGTTNIVGVVKEGVLYASKITQHAQ